MTRYLPWLANQGDESHPRKRIKIEAVKAIKAEDTDVQLSEEKKPIGEEDYMNDGLANDDGYIMVEDELLEIAHTFTAKLHSAELARLQEQLAQRKAESKAVSTLNSAGLTRERKIARRKDAHQVLLDKLVAGPESSTDNSRKNELIQPRFSSLSLSKLMTTSAPRYDIALAQTHMTTKSDTRAAAGFTKGSHVQGTSSGSNLSTPKKPSHGLRVVKEDDGETTLSSASEDSDDLDMMVSKPPIGSVSLVKPRSAPIKLESTALRSKPVEQLKVIPPPASAIGIRKLLPLKPVSKTKLILDDDDDFEDAAQAERFRLRREKALAKLEAS